MSEKKEIALSFSEQLDQRLTLNTQALPSDFNKPRFVQNALAVLNDNPSLAKINREQLCAGLMKGAFLGLDFMSKECYLIPYGNGVKFQTDYKGEVKFAKKYSTRPIKDIYSKVVRAGDEFEEKITDGQATIDFRPVPFNDGEIMGAFAVVLYTDGGMDYEVMSVKDINNVRNSYSNAANSKAWKNSFDEMCKKTVLRRLCKHISCDFESTEAIKAWEDGGDSEFNNRVVTPKKSTVNDILDDEVVIDGEIIEEGE